MMNQEQILIAEGPATIEAIPMLNAVAGAKKYSVIYADPPWKTKAGRALSGYKMENGKQLFAPVSNKSRELAYPSLSVKEISDLNIKDLAADHAHLYMWVTNKYLLCLLFFHYHKTKGVCLCHLFFQWRTFFHLQLE
jgi:hypothetical protein